MAGLRNRQDLRASSVPNGTPRGRPRKWPRLRCERRGLLQLGKASAARVDMLQEPAAGFLGPPILPATILRYRSSTCSLKTMDSTSVSSSCCRQPCQAELGAGRIG
jgi:hypothetical protein